jgi:acetoin utilization protein AcuB
MIVRYWMTEMPIGAVDEMNLFEVIGLIRKHGIRRLPVVRNQELVGIITLSDIYRFGPPSLLLKEDLPDDLAEELQRQRVGDVMTESPITCEPNMPLEEAGLLMREKKVGSLPVMDKGKLVGIITGSDVLDALASITRAGDDSIRICLSIPAADKLDFFYDIVEFCRRYWIDLLTILTHPLKGDKRHLVMIRVRGFRSNDFIQALWDNNYQILTMDDKTPLSKRSMKTCESFDEGDAEKEEKT